MAYPLWVCFSRAVGRPGEVLKIISTRYDFLNFYYPLGRGGNTQHGVIGGRSGQGVVLYTNIGASPSNNKCCGVSRMTPVLWHWGLWYS